MYLANLPLAWKPLILWGFVFFFLLKCVELSINYPIEVLKNGKQKWADILGKDSGMCETGKRRDYTHTLTARSLRHGRHGSLTHILLLWSTGPDRAPQKTHDYGLIPHGSRSHPPSKFISRENKKSSDRDDWVAGNLVHWLTESLLRRNFPSHLPFLLWAAEECFSFLRAD